MVAFAPAEPVFVLAARVVTLPPPPAPVPEPATARWDLEGDADEAWLERDGLRFEVGSVPPGHYQVMARFDDGAARAAGEVWLTEADHLRVRGKGAFSLCTAVGGR